MQNKTRQAQPNKTNDNIDNTQTQVHKQQQQTHTQHNTKQHNIISNNTHQTSNNISIIRLNVTQNKLCGTQLTQHYITQK